MATFGELKISISTIIQKPMYLDSMLETRINDAVSIIAAGVRMPNGQISPPLPDLFTTLTVSTATDAAYKTLGATYQRGVFSISDSNGDPILPPKGGDYYSFGLFLKKCQEKDLSESGSIHSVIVQGSNLYYQGIPTASTDLTVHCYRLPVDMSTDEGTPDGIPSHLSSRLIRHYVASEIFGEDIDHYKLRKSRTEYHEMEFYKAMQELVDFIGIPDAEPVYYGSDDFTDLGCYDGGSRWHQ